MLFISSVLWCKNVKDVKKNSKIDQKKKKSMNIFLGKPLLMPAMYTVLAGEDLGGKHFIFINKPLQQMRPQLSSLYISTISNKVLLCLGLWWETLYIFRDSEISLWLWCSSIIMNQNHLGESLNHRVLGHTLGVSDSLSLGWGLRIFISSKVPQMMLKLLVQGLHFENNMDQNLSVIIAPMTEVMKHP